MIMLLMLIVSLETTKAQRSLVLTNWFGTGTANMKYETIANNVIDANGHLLQQQLNARKDARGRTVYDCIDIMGILRKNGEEYERPNGKFKYKCNNGTEIITACVGSERTGNKLIKVGQALNIKGFWHKCIHNAKNETATYSEEASCNVNDKLYHVNDEVRSAFFLMKCTEDGYKVIGCYYLASNKIKVDMKPGTTIETDGLIHHCDDNNGNIQYYTTASECINYASKYKEGEQFAANHLRYECRNGMINIIGCYMGEMERNIEIGDIFVEKHMMYRCYSDNGAIKYEEYPCGLKDTPPCAAPPKQQMHSNLSLLPKPDPGFGAFSIAQYTNRVGDKMVTGSNTVKLEMARLDGIRTMHRPSN